MTPEAERRPRRAMQARMAIGMTALALGVAALVAVGGFLFASHLGTDPEPRTETRVEQIGDSVAIVQVAQDTAGAGAAANARQDALGWVLAALGIAFVPAAVAAWLVAGRMLRPVQRISEVVEAVDGSATADRTGLATADELGALAEGLDRMLDRLEANREEQAQRLHEVVHELRTPLTIISTNLELVGEVDDADTRISLEAARRAVERMGRTIDDFANHGRLALDGDGDGHLDLGAEARVVAGELLAPARQQGVRVAATGTDPLVVDGDRAALRTALDNLVSNALRVAPTGSTLTLTWGRHGGWAYVAVRDEGPGIAEDDHPRVFERYWQGHYERARSEADEPHGIGLTIARQAVEAQGGRLTMTSSLGVGSAFAIWLPASPAAEAAEVVAPDGVHSRHEPWSVPAPVV